ncbi:MAG: acyl-CoA dehydrogenase family protein [Acidimicrobiia bacterium]
MRFSFGDDQLLLAAGLRELLARECTPAHVRAVWDGRTGHDPALWAKLAGMGVLGLLLPESDGGTGLDEVDAVLQWQELGRAAAPGPVLEHMAVAAPALRGTRFAAGLADGSLVATAAGFDASPYVAHAQIAHIVVTPDGVVPTAGARIVDIAGIDGGRLLSTLAEFRTEPVHFSDQLGFERGALATAAYLVGSGERMIELAAEHARVRQQFGKPIGSFQAVKHLLADALLKIEFAKPAVYRAAWSVAQREPTVARDVSMAKALAGEAAYRAGRSAMQVHGGIGYTWEADLQLWMKKTWALMRAWGDSPYHRRRVAEAVTA